MEQQKILEDSKRVTYQAQKPMPSKSIGREKRWCILSKEQSDILKEYKKAGIDPNKPIIWYCNTGHLIGGNWLVQKYIIGAKDKDNRVYSGSMADYTRWPKRKLVKGDK